MKGMEETAFVRTVRPFPILSLVLPAHLVALPQLSKSAKAVGSAAYSASAPVRETEAYKAVASEITELLENAANDVQHGGYVDKEARRRRRQARLEKIGKSEAGGFAARKIKVEEDALYVSLRSPTSRDSV